MYYLLITGESDWKQDARLGTYYYDAASLAQKVDKVSQVLGVGKDKPQIIIDVPGDYQALAAAIASSGKGQKTAYLKNHFKKEMGICFSIFQALNTILRADLDIVYMDSSLNPSLDNPSALTKAVRSQTISLRGSKNREAFIRQITDLLKDGLRNNRVPSWSDVLSLGFGVKDA